MSAELPYALRFLFAARPAIMSEVLSVVSDQKGRTDTQNGRCRRRDLDPALRQCAESEYPLPHLFLDGVYLDAVNGSPARFRWVKAPTRDELTQLAHTIARRIGRFLERRGLRHRE
jgi:hypothetical protein